MKLPATFAAFRSPDFRLLWFGAVGSLTGAQMLSLARGYLAYQITGSAAALGFVTLTQGVPTFFLALFGGVVADRVKRRQLLLCTQSCLVINALITAVLVSTGLVQIWHLAILAMTQGSILSFNQPSRQAYLVELVNPNEMANAIALYNSGQTCVRIVAPSLAGLLISLPFIGLTYSFYFIAVCYTVPVLLLLAIRTPSRVIARRRAPMAREFAAGIRYVAHHEVLRMLIIAGIVPPLLGNSYQQLLPVFASHKVLGVGPSGLGLMATFSGFGALIGSLLVASFGNMRRRGLAQLSAGALFGISLIIFSRMHAFPLVLATLVGVGFAASSYQTLNSTLTVMASDPAFYGRVTSVQQLNMSLNALATLPIGFFVDQFSAPTVVMFNGICITLFWSIVGLFVRSYRSLELPQAEAAARIAEPESARVPP